MDCKHVNDHLIDYLYQELEPDQLDQIEGHLKSCDVCASELAAFESTRSAMRELPELEPPAALSQVLMREAAGAVTPEEEAGWWERLHAGLRMLVMHPAMTAAVVLVLVVGISFMVYQRGGPPSLEPRADDLPPVPPSASTTATAPKGAAKLAAAPRQLEVEQPPTETVTEGNEADKGGQATAGAQTVATTGAGAGAGGGERGQLARARGRGRRAPTRPAVAARPVYRKGPAPRKARRSSRSAAAPDDLVSGADRAEQSKAARSPHAPSPEPAVNTAATPAPRAARAPTTSPVATKDAYRWAAQGDQAMLKGDCRTALARYDRALRLQPALAKKIAGNVQHCVDLLGREGEKRLARAARQYPRLAGYFTREIARRRAEAEASRRRAREAPTRTKARAKPAPPRQAPTAQ